MDAVLLIDGGFLKPKYKQAFGRHLEAADLAKFANIVLCKSFGKNPESISFRAYYYDCPPFKGTVKIPLSDGAEYDFGAGPSYEKLDRFLNEVKLLPYFAVREGFLSFQGWELKSRVLNKVKSGPISITSNDFKASLKQKGVDTKIGLDIAWVSYEKIASRIILVTGDSDFVPAVKTARRNGVFVTLFSLHHGIKSNLRENVDVLFDEDLKYLIA